MRTRNLFRYLLAALALLGNVSFVVAQQQTRITFDLQSGWYNGELTQVTATYNHDMPLEDIRPIENRTVKLGIPESNNGPFGGYYDQPGGQGTQYYKCENGEIKSARKWDKTDATATLYAYWVSGSSEPTNTYTVILDAQGGTGGSASVTATLNIAMPSATAPTRTGYTFGGYFTGQNGAGTQYYNADMTSANYWNISVNTTLYAKWTEENSEQGTGGNTGGNNTYTVTLDAQGGIGGTESITATYGEPLPSGENIVVPQKTGYVFMGYRDQTGYISNGELYTQGTEYYNSKMEVSTEWKVTGNKTLYAQWQPAICRIRFYSNGGKFPDGSMAANNSVKSGLVESVDNENGIMTLKVYFGFNFGHQLIQANPKKPGYEYLGWYVKGEEQTPENQIYTVDKASWNANATTNHEYWKQGTDANGQSYLVWNCTHDVELEAKYDAKFIVNDDVIIFKEGSQVEADEFWVNGVVNDISGAVNECIQTVSVIDLTRSRNYFNGNGGYEISKVMEVIRKNNNISPNLLVYFNTASWESSYNAISNNICQNLVVTDRYPMKIPYGFTAQKATYERNKAQKDEKGEESQDAMWAQSYKSVWGTLCLPYPIKNDKANNKNISNDGKIIFYELRGTHDNYMQFYEMEAGKVIPENTPVLYCRKPGAGIGSAVTVQESNVLVPVNKSYAVNEIKYSEKFPVADNPNTKQLVDEDWRFIGTLEIKKFCTKAYSDLCIQKGAQAEFLAGAEVLDPDNEKIPYREIYYFKQDKFTHMTSGVTILPYRAYFDRKKIEESTDQIGESKVSSYSILVMDDDGTTTDITNLIDNHEAKGNGKIYDLSGRRVKQPVKGSIYIVDGKKKMY